MHLLGVHNGSTHSIHCKVIEDRFDAINYNNKNDIALLNQDITSNCHETMG